MQKEKEKLIARQIKSKDNYSIILFVEKKLGKGSFGECYLGYDSNGKQLLAIKSIAAPRNAQDYQSTKQKYIKEVANLAALTHQKQNIFTTQSKLSNLVAVHPHTFISDDNFYIAMQFCEGGDLEHLIDEYQTKRFTTTQFLLIMTDIVEGYQEIRSKGLIHEDLKPENIFIKNGYFKIGDFGLAFKLVPGKKAGRGGSRPYNAPQKYTSAQPSHLSDIFALGVIFYELYYNKHPFYTTQEWDDYQSYQIEQIIKKDKEMFIILRGPLTNKRKMELNRMFYQFLMQAKVKNHQPWIKKEHNVLNKENHKKLQQLIKTMISKKPEDRPDFQKLRHQLNELNLPHKYNRSILKVVPKMIPEQCTIYIGQIEETNPLSKSYILMDPVVEYHTEKIESLKLAIQKNIVRSRILADLYYECNATCKKYEQDETLELISLGLLQQALLFAKGKLREAEKEISSMSEEQKVSFYSHNHDSLIGVLKNHCSYLRGLLQQQPDKAMQKQRLKILQENIGKYFSNIIILGSTNSHIVVALDLYKEVIHDQGNPERFLQCKRNIMYNRTSRQEAEQVYIKRRISLPPILQDN